MRTPRSISTLLLILLALPTLVHGAQTPDTPQDISPLEQLLNTEVTTVTGASKYQQELTNAPATVSIITADDIRKNGYRTLAEALNGVRGFFITYHRTYHFVGALGVSPLGDFNTRILLLVDGHRLNDGIYEEAPLGSDFPVDLDLVDRIEVIRGPGSSIYGTNAFLAVINVITRKGKTVKGGEFAATGGSFNAWTGRVTVGDKPENGVDLLFSGSWRDSTGKQKLSFPEYAATNNGIADGLDGENSWDILAKAEWKNISMTVLHQTRNKNTPNAEYGAIFNAPGETFRDLHTLAGLSYSRAGGFADINARLTYNRYEYESDYPLGSPGSYTLNRDTALSQWMGSDLFASKSLGPHLVTVGMEHRWQFTEQQRNFDISPTYNSYLDDNHRTYVQGYYLQDEFHILQNLILNAGLRYDHYNTFGGTLNPRGAVIWKPVESSVLKLSYGEAFRAPNAYEQYYSDRYSMKGNDHLKPEKIHSTELTYDQYIGNNLRTSITGFYTRISGLLTQLVDPTDGFLVFCNQNRIESTGVDLHAEGKLESGLSGRISYTYQEAENLDTATHLDNSPRNMVKGGLTLPIPAGKSFATIESIYTGSRTNTKQEKIGGASVVNLTLLNREMVKGLEISGSIYNLFDKRYGHPASADFYNSNSEYLRSIAQDGITFRIKASYRF